MKAYRLAREPYANSLSGRGVAIRGARWNSVGIEIVYTASNKSLAMAEVVVHLSAATVPDDYMMVTLEIPDDLKIKELSISALPMDWNVFPYSSVTQSFGDDFIHDNDVPILRVPSAVVQGEFNLLLNPFHPDFKKIKIDAIEKFSFDSRLFR